MGSGKGVAASIVMSHLHVTFRTPRRSNRMVQDANRIFCESTLAGQFATIAVRQATRDTSQKVSAQTTRSIGPVVQTFGLARL